MARTDPPSPRRAVTRAEDFYAPPPTRPADAWRLVPPAERAIRWFEEKAQRRLPVPSGILLGVTVYAQINHGRWVADCPECGSAQIVSPADPRMFCVECLTGWFRITFPPDAVAAEHAVVDLPVREQNWWHPDDTAWNRPRKERQPTAKELELQKPQPEPEPQGKEPTP